ncbi:IS21 family transposase [bacterium]|nr:IS21 family transposase [bacterium]
MHFKKTGKIGASALRAGMDEKTARKCLRSGKLPSESQPDRSWRTREDPFAEDWAEVTDLLENEEELQAKTIFAFLQRRSPGKYQDGQLRTLQRRIKQWRALHGSGKDVIFPQVHVPGQLSASDFTHMGKLGVTITSQPFDHLLFHFVLTYSNWETGTVCFSESFESLSEGLQNALWELGGVTASHRTDQLSAAVQQDLGGRRSFTKRYAALMDHYRMSPQKIQAGAAHENGDAEKSHDLIKTAVDQELMLRGSRDFASRAEYEQFLHTLFARRNAGRQVRFAEEQSQLRALPARRLESAQVAQVRVRSDSTISVARNVYSVPSRLIGERVEVRVTAEELTVRYAGTVVAAHIPRLRGTGGHRINYRHVISSLVRKPGAFAHYKYQADLFPSTRFRMAYDILLAQRGAAATREYLGILELAAQESETAVDDALRILINSAHALSVEAVTAHLHAGTPSRPVSDVHIDRVDLTAYDRLTRRVA